MPVFPWRFIDSLLGRSRPGDEETATGADVNAEIERLSERLQSDTSLAEHLDGAALAVLRDWAELMFRHRAPQADGRSRRDANVQLGAVNGAIRALVRAIDEAFASQDDTTGQRLAWRLRSLESEISSPLYTLDEQAVVRARLERLLDEIDKSDVPRSADAISQLVTVLTPPES